MWPIFKRKKKINVGLSSKGPGVRNSKQWLLYNYYNNAHGAKKKYAFYEWMKSLSRKIETIF